MRNQVQTFSVTVMKPTEIEIGECVVIAMGGFENEVGAAVVLEPRTADQEVDYKQEANDLFDFLYDNLPSATLNHLRLLINDRGKYE